MLFRSEYFVPKDSAINFAVVDFPFVPEINTTRIFVEIFFTALGANLLMKWPAITMPLPRPKVLDNQPSTLALKITIRKYIFLTAIKSKLAINRCY